MKQRSPSRNFLRGFNLDHGTDFTTYLDDVPLNLRTQGHGQGYLDVNGLIPEAIERIDYRKGTYRADTGDFSMAGSPSMTTARSIEPFVAAEAGAYGWQRVAAGSAVDVGRGTLTGMGQWKTCDGPWELPENWIAGGRWGTSVRVRHLGEYPLLEDNSQRAAPEITVNIRGAWKAGLWTVYAELLNVFDEHGKDIV